MPEFVPPECPGCGAVMGHAPNCDRGAGKRISELKEENAKLRADFEASLLDPGQLRRVTALKEAKAILETTTKVAPFSIAKVGTEHVYDLIQFAEYILKGQGDFDSEDEEPEPYQDPRHPGWVMAKAGQTYRNIDPSNPLYGNTWVPDVNDGYDPKVWALDAE